MKKITKEDFTRVNNDINGNPRYVMHYLKFIKDTDKVSVFEGYDFAVKRAKELGGKKYRGKEYGGGIVFTTYDCLHDFSIKLNKLINE